MEKKRKGKGARAPATTKVKKSGSSVSSNKELAVKNGDSLNTEMFTPEDFLAANEKVSILSLTFLKNMYDLTKSNEKETSLENPLSLETDYLRTIIPITTRVKKKKRKQGALSKTEAPVPALITEDFDEDQIWEELELQNTLMYENLVSSISKLLAYKDKTSLEREEEDSDVLSASEEDIVDNVEDLDDSEEEIFDLERGGGKNDRQPANRQYKRSVVDDRFFSLSQMTEHIEQLEAEMERKGRDNSHVNDGENDLSSSDEESIDLFEDVPSESDDEKEDSNKYYYNDFFDPPTFESDTRTNSGKDIIVRESKREMDKSKTFHAEDEEDEDEEQDEDQEEEEEPNAIFDQEESEEDDNDGEGVEKADDKVATKQLGRQINETLSTFERRKKKIEENISEIENQALEPKSWHLLGESTADNRPENALLEEHLMYDHLVRPAPEITMETTMKLEDVIKQRVRDGTWDDVQRKVKPVEDPREYKKRLVLDAEKSKSSLAEIYEKEYLDQKKAEGEGHPEEKEPEEHIQIKKEMHSLFQKLDALSNFNFTPKPATAEIKIVSNMPSISVEETATVNVSDANMLAPQEIQDHVSGGIKGKEERTATDKKRERRKKKKKQHLNRMAQEEKARNKGLGLRNIKLAEGIVKSQQKNKNNASADSYSTSYQTGKELKSSKAFFAKLQEGAASHIDKIAKRKSSSNNYNTNSNTPAKKFKL